MKETIVSELHGKVAVITGGANGIGLACARKLSDEGATIVIADIDLAAARKQADELPTDSLGVHLDVRDSGSANDLASTVMSTFGRVDILVNNAGMNIGARNTVDVTDEEFDRLMSINVRGTFTVTRALLPALIEQRGGSIVNMSSICGQRGVALIAAYCASKFAIVGMTKSFAAEFAQYDITVNSVHPGIVATDLHDKVVKEFRSADCRPLRTSGTWWHSWPPAKLGTSPHPSSTSTVASWCRDRVSTRNPLRD
jgi:NAD(P)-dependent dehydrogenase (short-subunit alcohol dehydrogenase family)